MKQFMKAAPLILASMSIAPAFATQVCDAVIDKCYMLDLDSGIETELTNDFQYELEEGDRYSIRCDVVGHADRAEFIFDGEVSDDWMAPFWMKNNADDGTGRVWDARYLTKCGAKEIDVAVYLWGVEEACATKKLTLEAVCETPPEIQFCRRAAFFLEYQPAVPMGYSLEARKIANQEDSRKIAVKDSEATRVHLGALRNKPTGIHAWFHSFRKSAFELRYVDAMGNAGPWKKCNFNTPIGLDIDHSGAVERISGEFKIDITGDGHIETLLEWFAPTEGILIDSTLAIEEGVVSGHHLFGDLGGTYTDGYAKLMEHDNNSNGYVEGAELEGFAIWTDANSNVKVDEGELSSLASHNIVALSVVHDNSYASEALLKDGSTMYMEDLWFNTQRR